MSYKATAWAYDMRLSSPMKPVLVVLADMADEAGTCFPGQQRIADMTGLGIRTVARALVKLERLGLISRYHRQDAYGHRTSDRFVLHLSVTVPESLPVTLPTRQRAYMATSPSQPVTQSIPTGHSDRGTTSRTTNESPGGAPKPFCPKHDGGTTERCKACGDARRAFDAWTAEKRATPTQIPPRGDVVAEHEHVWLPNDTCKLCPARRWDAA